MVLARRKSHGVKGACTISAAIKLHLEESARMCDEVANPLLAKGEADRR